MNSSIQFQIRAGVASIVLNRPAAANALTLEMSRALFDVAVRCEDDESVRVVVLTGTGKAFCAGGDLQGMVDAGDEVTHYLNELTAYLHAAIACFTRMEKLVVAAVNGTAAGAGLGLVAMSDLAIAAASAKFTSAYTAVALTPDAGVSFLLPRVVGRKRALDMMIRNSVLTAEQARDWGLVNEVVPDAHFQDIVQQQTEALASRPTRTFGRVKALLNAADPGLETHMAVEGRSVARSAGETEASEAIRGFLARRREPKES